jgi:hypothetical protein
MNSYRYRVTVEKLSDAGGEPVHGQCLSFYTANPDDILAVVNQLQDELPFDAGTAASLGVGWKLFSEVARVHGSHPLFTQIRPALSEFVPQLKARLEAASSGV